MANTGTAQIIPIIPNRDPNTKMENRIQKLPNPMESPKIFGPIIFPSTCIKIMIRIKNKIPLVGLAINTRIALGMIPIYCPKNGMILVTPMTTLISSV